MKPKKIKLFWSLGLTRLLLLSAAGVLPVLWPRLFPSHYVSDLYLHYEHNPHIRTTELHSFHINDTLSVDVLLLQATDSLGWETLKNDFHIIDPPTEVVEIMKNTNQSVTIQLTPKDDIGAPADTTDLDNNYILATDHLEYSIGILCAKNKKERTMVMHYKYNTNTLKTY